MALRDPVSVYNAAHNLEAHLLVNALEESGIEAFVTEDVSQVGVWIFGLLPEIHKPQVWIDRSDRERAQSVLGGFERRTRELRAGKIPPGDAAIDIVCEKCGAVCSFPSTQRGSVQNCPRCGTYVDVGLANELAEGIDPDDGSATDEPE